LFCTYRHSFFTSLCFLFPRDRRTQGFAAAALASLLIASPPSELMMRAPPATQEDIPPAAAAAAAAPSTLNNKGAFDDWVSATFSVTAAAPAAVPAPAASPVSLAVPSGTPTALDGEEAGNVRLFRESTPSVVFITNKVLQRTGGAGYSLDATAVPAGAGSGFVYDDKGHIVTNFHVVKGANELTVTFQGDPKVYEAKLLGYDADKDVAVLHVDKSDLRPIPLGRSSSLEVGQKVFAIGNPFGLDHTLTTGIVSGLGRELDSGNTGRPILGVIQTDAAINPGNSGGPLLDSGGRLVGINTAILSSSGTSAGVSFALPIDNVKGIVEQIIQFGRVTRPVLGLVLGPDGALPQLLGPGAPDGVLVLGVAQGGPAQVAGILAGLVQVECS
jgi:S1-C subfamily serine protease